MARKGAQNFAAWENFRPKKALQTEILLKNDLARENFAQQQPRRENVYPKMAPQAKILPKNYLAVENI